MDGLWPRAASGTEEPARGGRRTGGAGCRRSSHAGRQRLEHGGARLRLGGNGAHQRQGRRHPREAPRGPRAQWRERRRQLTGGIVMGDPRTNRCGRDRLFSRQERLGGRLPSPGGDTGRRDQGGAERRGENASGDRVAHTRKIRPWGSRRPAAGAQCRKLRPGNEAARGKGSTSHRRESWQRT